MYAMGSYYDDDYNYGGLPRNAIEILTGKRVYSLATSSKENIYLEENIAKLGKLDEKRIKKYLDNNKLLVMISLADADKKRDGAHAFIFKSYDEKNVYLVNPYDTGKTESIPKEEFYKKLIRIDYTDLTAPIDNKLANSKYLNIIETEDVKKYLKSKNKE